MDPSSSSSAGILEEKDQIITYLFKVTLASSGLQGFLLIEEQKEEEEQHLQRFQKMMLMDPGLLVGSRGMWLANNGAANGPSGPNMQDAPILSTSGLRKFNLVS